MVARRSVRGIKAGRSKPLKLGVEIKDFGPINTGKIDLKPLTLFIGPNNAGKSYAAMLIHSIFESQISTESISGISYSFKRRFPPPLIDRNETRNVLFEESKKIRRLFKKLKDDGEFEVPDSVIERLTRIIFRALYEKKLSTEIERSYASQLDHLIRIGKRTFSLKINFNSESIDIKCRKKKLEIEKYPQIKTKIIVKKIGKQSRDITISRGIMITTRRKKDNGTHIIEIDESIVENREEIMLFLMNEIVDICESSIPEKSLRPCYYLPAARSGILQGHKALISGIIEKAPYAGLKRFGEIPQFSGIVSDFLSSIMSRPEEKGPFYPLALEFERELINGEIVYKTLDDYSYPEIKYKYLDTEIPLHRTSSTVSELAPLFLYLKYIVEPGSILMIEEPEAHLHPKNQRIMAKILVKLIRGDVNIVITTHSEYLLEQLNNFILMGEVPPEKRVEKFDYSKEDYLKSDEVSAYVFKCEKGAGGSKINEIEITEEGISQEEFLKVTEELYDEVIQLRRTLELE